MKVLRRIKKHTTSAIKHFRTHGHKYAGGMFAGFAVVKAFFVIAGFFGLVGLGHTFAQTPADLIAQYYGPTSTYTTNRVSNTCDTSAMQVIEIADNTGWQTLLSLSGYGLAANTLYVLDSGNYTLYSQLYDNNCTAIIGSGTVQIQAVGMGSSLSLLYANSKQNMIVDNIKLKGEVPGVATSFGINIEGVQSNTISGTEISAVDYGIRINSYSHDNTINNDVVHNINNYGIFIRSYGYNNIIKNCSVYSVGQNGIIVNDHSTNNIVENCDVHNNYYGIHLSMTSANNIIRNDNSYSNTQYGIYIDSSSNALIDSVQTHDNASVGIYFSSSPYGIVNNAQSYNNSSVGIYFYYSSTGTVNNSWSHNDSYGIYFDNSSFGTVNNSQVANSVNNGIDFNVSSNGVVNNAQSYNNTGIGIYFYTAPYGVVNNTQSYNNSTGISFNASSYGVLNNVQSYNNNGYGISVVNSPSGVVNNIQSYNNASYGLYVDAASTNSKYYGAIKLFGNTPSNFGGTLTNLLTGNNGLVGWSNGTVDLTPAVSRDYLTNPLNLSGKYLLGRSGSFTSLRGKIATFVYASGMQYSYGSGILAQGQPVLYSGTTLIASGTFTGTNYIGGTTLIITGNLSGVNTYSPNANIPISSTVSDPASMYNIYGDVKPFITARENNETIRITLSGGLTTDRVVIQMYDPINYFATHFEKDTHVDMLAPTLPTLLSPASGTIVTTGTISFSRSGSIDTGAGLSGYSYQVSRDAGFTNLVSSGTTVMTGISLTGISNGVLYRRVSAYDVLGNVSARSTLRNVVISSAVPTSPDLLSPVSGTIVTTGAISFLRSGSIDTGAVVSGYLYQVSSDLGFTNILYTGMTAMTGISLDGFMDGDYYRRALAYDTMGNTGSRSSGQNFLVDTTAPTIPDLLSPASGTILTTGAIDFLRSGAIDTGAGLSDYMVQVSRDSGFTDMIISGNTSATGISVIEFPDGIYYRRISAYDAVGNTGSRSDTWNLLVDTTAPTIPELLSPTSGTIFGTGTISFLRSGSIDTGAGLSGYLYQVSSDSGFTNFISSGTTSLTGISLPSFTDGTFYRRVSAFDDVGNTGARSSGGSFFIDTTAPTIPELLSPSSATIFTTGSIDLVRSGGIDTGAGMSGYLFQVSRDSGFTDMIISGNTSATGISVIEFPDGNYYRRISAYDAVGNTGSRSTGRNFIVNTTTTNSGTIIPPSVPTGGGGIILSKDICPAQRDCSSSYYDHICGPCPSTGTHTSAPTSGNIQGSHYSDEFNIAYQRSYANGITTIPTIQQANINGKVTREQLAKMITQYAVKVMKKKVDTKLSCSFPDIIHESAEMQFYIKTSCQLGLMGREADGLSIKKSFDPKQNVTRAQFSTVVSRMLYGEKYNTKNFLLWYARHLQALHTAGIINDINKPSADELRGYIMLILRRTTKGN